MRISVARYTHLGKKRKKKGERKIVIHVERGNREKRSNESKASASCACQFTRGTLVDRRGAECRHRVAERKRERATIARGGRGREDTRSCEPLAPRPPASPPEHELKF